MMIRRVVPNEELIPEIARLIEEGSQTIFTPKGVSMLPFIRGNCDSVLLGRAEGLEEWDIVLARQGGRYVLHRIYRIEGDVLTLMGDGNIAGQEMCRAEDVIAVVLKIIRNGKETDCRSVTHRRNARIWRRLQPLRRYLLAIYKRIML